MVVKQRPVNLDLFSMRFPITAIASILHRVCGVVLFVGVAILLWLLATSLASASGFAQAQTIVTHPLGKLMLWLILTALIYHLIGGLRHLVMDFGVWEELPSATLSAQLSFGLTGALALLLGVWLW